MKNVLLILALATLWWLGGWVAGAGLSAFFGVTWALQCASLNVVAGLLMLLWITRDKEAQRIFYEGPEGNEPGMPVIAFLWVLPLSLMFAGVIWWLMGQFLK